MLNHYYIPFIPTAKIDYPLLFVIIMQAEYNEVTKAYDTIHYKSIKDFAKMIGSSSSTINRILKDEVNNDYRLFITADKANKTIHINNSFTNSKDNKVPFVMLKYKEVEFLCIYSNVYNKYLLCRYYIYLKYYCGYTKNNTDFTAN